jgi:hypothetical protein
MRACWLYCAGTQQPTKGNNMLKIWGRPDGSNVIKAMWCIGELGIPHQRIDWGGVFGVNDDA